MEPSEEKLINEVGKETFWWLVENEEWDLMNDMYHALFDYCMSNQVLSSNHEEFMDLVERLEAE